MMFSFVLLLFATSVAAADPDNQEALLKQIGRDRLGISAAPSRDAAISVLRRVDRARYCRDCAHPYEDAPQGLGISGQTISAPHMHLFALERVLDRLQQGASRVLDIGCGSGYLTAAFHEAAAPGSLIIGIDNNAEIAALAEHNLRAERPEAFADDAVKRIEIHVANGFDGYPAGAPYNVIHVGAAAPPAVLETLKRQLKDGGVIVMPIEEGGTTEMVVIRKKEGGEEYEAEASTQVRYVPLTNQIV